MTLLSRIDQARNARSVPSLSQPTFNLGMPTDKHTEYGDYLATSNDVYSVAWTIAKMLAKLPVYGKNQADKIVGESHPLMKLMAAPNPHTTGLKFRLFIQLCLTIWGRVPVIIERQGRTIRELWPVKPTLVTPVADPSNLISHYLFHSPGGMGTIRFELDELIYLAYPDPADASQLGSLAPMSAARLAADTATASQESNRNLFRQGMVGGGFIHPPDDRTITKDQADSMERKLMEKFRGTQNAHRWSVMEFPFKMEAMNVTPKDAQFIEGMNMSFRQVCRALGITPQLVGDAEFATLANLRVYERLFWEQTGEFNALFFGSEMTRQLAPAFGLKEIGLDLSAVVALQEDENDKWTRSQSQLAAGVMLINEWREQEGLDPVPWGDTWYAPGNLVPVDGSETTGTLDELEELQPLTEALEDDLRGLYAKQRDDMIRRVKAGERSAAYDPQIWDGKFREALSGRLTAILSQCLAIGAAEIGVPVKEVTPRLVSDALDVVRVLSALTVPLEGDKDSILAGIESVVSERSPRRVADASTAAAASLAFLVAWNGTGVKKRWRTRSDDRVRESHAHLEGSTKNLDEMFRIGSCSGLGPGLSLGCPEEIYNCFPGDTRVSALSTITKSYRRWWEGDAVLVKTRNGGELTGTPNHPVLTQRGWVPLGELTEGDYLIRDRALVEGVPAGHPDPQRPPASMKQVHRLASKQGVGHRVTGTESDFHGDGLQGDVHVVGTDGLLLNGLQSTVAEFISDERLALPDVTARLLADERSEFGFGLSDLTAPDRGMGRSREALALLDRQTTHPDSVLLGTRPQPHTSLDQTALDRRSADSVSVSESVDRFASLVVADEIVGVYGVPFAGHVFNLETTDGWYIANGVVVHNCRCRLVAVQPKREHSTTLSDVLTTLRGI